MNHQRRIGIFAGTFDPIHAGHVAFALQAVQDARLGEVYFMPERRPRHKTGVEHFGHRAAMITRAIRPYQRLGLLELPDVFFDVRRTLPKLHKEFPGAELALLVGSDVAIGIAEWPDIQRLLKDCELIVGTRSHTEARIHSQLSHSGLKPRALTVVRVPTPHIASTVMRKALRCDQHTPGLLTSVRAYARTNWLYVSVATE